MHIYSLVVIGTRQCQLYLIFCPRTELDYGNLQCWGENSIGVQRQPCTFHIIPAGPPDSLREANSLDMRTITVLRTLYAVLRPQTP